jgi:hypothetical protein
MTALLKDINQMTKPLVTIITATTGSKYLEDTLKSVVAQTYENIQHLVIIDGKHRQDDARRQINKWGSSKTDVVTVPYSVGEGGWNGHRIYGGASYWAQGEYFIFLDDDNTLDSNHVTDLVDAVTKKPNFWSYSLRKIIDSDGNYVCHDDCESLGQWHTILHPEDFFVDVNCYLIPRNIAIEISPVWYRKFRQPGQMEIDRAIYHYLSKKYPDFDSTYKYSVNYRAGNTERSVQKEFFLQGNQKMYQIHNGNLPWKKLV